MSKCIDIRKRHLDIFTPAKFNISNLSSLGQVQPVGKPSSRAQGDGTER